MRSFLQLRYIIICGAGGVRTEVVLEVLVERVRHLHLAVDDELHVVSDACSRGVDAVLVLHLSHEVRR